MSLALTLFSVVTLAEPFTVASFNIHYITPNQEAFDWPERRDAVRQVVGEMEADILAFQEMETFVGGNANPQNLQLDWVLEHHPSYQAGAVGEADRFPITQPILFRADRFELLDQGWFFYSETPDQIYSRTFNGGYPAFTSWVLLRDLSTGAQVRVLNNHFDYASGRNRRLSARLVADFIAPDLAANQAVIVLGDFNAPSFWSPMPFLRRQGLNLISPSGGTHHFNKGRALLPAIDHILVSDTLMPQSDIQRFTQSYDGVYPSDHYPITARVMVTPEG